VAYPLIRSLILSGVSIPVHYLICCLVFYSAHNCLSSLIRFLIE